MHIQKLQIKKFVEDFCEYFEIKCGQTVAPDNNSKHKLKYLNGTKSVEIVYMKYR